jgi:hypothetical protein
VKNEIKLEQNIELTEIKPKKSKEINPNKMHIDKDKYYIVYQEKGPSKEEEKEPDDNEAKKIRKEKIYLEKKRKNLKFNQHLNENESGKNVYKEYIPKKD